MLLTKGAIENLVIGDGVTSIAKGAFQGCTGIKSVTIGRSVESISPGAFEGCGKIKEVHFKYSPENMPRILIGYNPELDGAEIHYNDEPVSGEAPRQYLKTGEINLW